METNYTVYLTIRNYNHIVSLANIVVYYILQPIAGVLRVRQNISADLFMK